MSVATTYTAQGIISGSVPITVEADINRGLHAFTVVGLAGKAIDEAKDRVSAAIKNSGYPAPKSQNHKITISLSPADVKKEGPLFDLPIAVAYLLAAAEITTDKKKRMFIGELSLNGELRPVRGALLIAQIAQANGYTEIILPEANACEAALVENIAVYGAKTLKEVIEHISPEKDTQNIVAAPVSVISDTWHEGAIQLEDIKGQEQAKRGLLIAAAGRHNVIMVGPPGTGKTMLARAFQNLLPPLSRADALAVTAIRSIAGELGGVVSSQPPFRAPHHTASHTALVGGGSNPRPGEVTLAHKGVLFADEFPEFERRSIDALRQPLEDRIVTISRVQGTAVFPADFILVAAMNPYRGTEDGSTNYAASMMETYKGKISGPILDRIDLWLPVPHVDYETLTKTSGEAGETARARANIVNARQRMGERLDGRDITTNAEMSARDIEDTIELTDDVKEILKAASQKLNLSPRSYHRVIKVARTIADLDDQETIAAAHLYEALQYRIPV